MASLVRFMILYRGIPTRMTIRYAYARFGASQCHTGFKVEEALGDKVRVSSDNDVCRLKNASDLTILPEGQRFCGILWVGGWDDYVLDMTTIRDMTPEEIAEGEKAVKSGAGLPPLINKPAEEGKWLRGYFTKDMTDENQCVKIVRHLGGGDWGIDPQPNSGV
jgi:hypothetical protein